MIRSTPRRNSERGSALFVTLIIISSLLAGAAVLVGLQLASVRSTDLTRTGMTAIYCAEAGLAAARPAVATNYGQWNASLGQTTEPAWLSGINHDLDGDGVADYYVTLRDNDDEQDPLANNPLADNDLTVFLISTCTKYVDTPKQVQELVRYSGGGNCYQSQIGGCGGNGNSN